jgi:CheY-like chemotaxis protein
MDHMMPEMDGIEATQIIRNEIGTEYAQTIPILALTANAIVGNEEMFLNSGFQAFLSKPIDIIAMDAVIRKWVRDKNKEAAYEQETGKAISDRRSHVDRRKQSDRRGGADRRDLQAAGNVDDQDKATAQGKVTDHTHGAASDQGNAADHTPGAVSDQGKAADCAPRAASDQGNAAEGDVAFDISQGLARFGGDRDIYLEVLRSYAKNTPGLLEKLSTFAKSTLSDYAIIVHGIKSSSLSIGAALVGEQAAALEKAAKEGNADFVEAENSRFVQSVETLLAQVSAYLDGQPDDEPKPVASEPDAEILDKLKAACMDFDIDGVDEAIANLRAFRYESGSDLVEWIEAQATQMKFKEIIERLL